MQKRTLILLSTLLLAASVAIGMPTEEGTATSGTYTYTAAEQHTLDCVAVSWPTPVSGSSNTVTLTITTHDGTAVTTLETQTSTSLASFVWMPSGGQIHLNVGHVVTVTDTLGTAFRVGVSRTREN